MTPLAKSTKMSPSLSYKRAKTMSYRFLIYEVKSSVARITLNRPRAGNVLNESLAQELRDVCNQVNQDTNVRVVVLSGAGNKAFCLGNELEHSFQKKVNKLKSLHRIQDFLARYSVASSIANINCPVIAAVNGDALGQGLELALACDLRISTTTSHFGFPYIASGLLPADGGTQRLPRLTNRGKSLELILSGDLIDSQGALRIGLVNKIVPPAKLAAEVDHVASKIKERAPFALRFAKEAINKGLDLTLEQGLRLEADLYFLLHTTQDRTEGITAFRNKRVPRFQGK